MISKSNILYKNDYELLHIPHKSLKTLKEKRLNSQVLAANFAHLLVSETQPSLFQKQKQND